MSDLQANDELEQPVPKAWRALLSQVVAAFVRRDYSLSCGVDGVRPVSPETADQVRGYVEDYGETLVELPEATWDTSVVQMVTAARWDVFVDLWTTESGPSDMVLSGHFDSAADDALFEVRMVYVP